MRNQNRDLQQSKLTDVTHRLSRQREISSHTFRLLLYGLNQTCIWSTAVSEHPQYNPTKIRPVGAQLLRMDRQTDRYDEAADSRFSQLFCESF